MHIVNSFENTKLSRIYQHATLTSWMKQSKKNNCKFVWRNSTEWTDLQLEKAESTPSDTWKKSIDTSMNILEPVWLSHLSNRKQSSLPQDTEKNCLQDLLWLFHRNSVGIWRS